MSESFTCALYFAGQGISARNSFPQHLCLDLFRFYKYMKKKIAAQWKTLSFNYIIVPIINVEIAYHSFCLWVKRVLAFRIDKCFLTGVDEFCDLLYYYMVAILGYYKSIFFIIIIKEYFYWIVCFFTEQSWSKVFWVS